MREWFDKAFLVVVCGGLFYCIFFFFKDSWFANKPKIQRIMNIVLSIFIVVILIVCMFDLLTPNMNEDSLPKAEQVLEVVDMFLNDEISVKPTMEICEAYINSYHFTYEPSESRRETEENVYAAMHWIYDYLFNVYFEEIAIYNEECIIIGEKTRDENGKIIEDPNIEPGYELWCSADDAYEISELESHRNYLAKLLKLPYDAAKIDFDYSQEYLRLNRYKELYYE